VVPRIFAAVDLGASSGRVMAGMVERDRIDLREVERFSNAVAQRNGHLRWDVTTLYGHIQSGLGRVPEAESVGVDAWGVDYGLLGEDGDLLAEPISYRDGGTDQVIEFVHERIPPEDIFRITGTQFLPFNTIYQLVAEQQGPLWTRARHAVLIPDLMVYWLTGELGSEITDASTTSLLDLATSTWSTELLSRLGIPADMFPPIDVPGSTRGVTQDGVAVVTVGSHDTASAVAAVPATTQQFAYISSGTWSLVGLELERPIVSDDARRANFTNEVGVDRRTRFLRNVGGLWLYEECIRSWGVSQPNDLLEEAGRLRGGGPIFDPDDPALIAPGDMPARIAQAALGPESYMEPVALVRCILDSLAAAYARTLTQASALADREIDVVHIVGGGSQNRLLCQLTADATRRPVVAGPVEATALGNVLLQAQSVGAFPPSLEELRACVAASSTLSRYDPREFASHPS
jgi:rhamnulokinase